MPRLREAHDSEHYYSYFRANPTSYTRAYWARRKMPPPAKRRAVGSRFARSLARGRRSYHKQPYGKKSRRSGRLFNRGSVRPSVGRPIRAPLVHRRLNSEVLAQLPLSAAGSVTPLTIYCPDVSWGSFDRGLDIGQTAGNAVRSRNVTFNYRVVFPALTPEKTPYELRVITGFCKVPVSGEIQPSVPGQGAYDGIIVNFDPAAKWKDHILEQLNTALGNVRGTSFPSGNIAGELIRVVSDRTHVVNSTSITEDGAGAGVDSYNFPTLERNYNLRTNTRMRLYPTSLEDPEDWDGKKMCPVNNPRLQIPFCALLVKNFAAYNSNAKCPFTQGTWTHYWADQ